MTEIRAERSQDAGAIRNVLEAALPEVVEAELVDSLRVGCDDSISLIALDSQHIQANTFGFTTLIGAPAQYAAIWSKISAN
jgi:predicted N-acetyltransferase YhbS